MDRPPFCMDHRMQSSEDSKAVYDYIYRWPTARFGLYGSHTNRDAWFIEKVKRYFPIVEGNPAPRILDASCGRGHLSRSLKAIGYDVEATEISEYLFKEEFPKTMAGIPTHLLAYDELDRLPAKSFDVVISNDVLEHLPSEEILKKALVNFQTLSRGLIMLAIGMGRNAYKYPIALGMSMPERSLHTFHLSRFKWAKITNLYLNKIETDYILRSIMYIGRAK